MGKTLMDGKSKDHHQSTSESYESFRSLLLLKMSKRNRSHESYTSNSKTILPEIRQQETSENSQDLNDVTSPHADSKFHQISRHDRIIPPSAPPLVDIPLRLEKICYTGNQPLVEKVNNAPKAKVSALKLVDNTKILENMNTTSNTDDGRYSQQQYLSVPQSPMDCFRTDACGFIEELQVSQESDWMTSLLTIFSIILVALTFPFSMLFCLKTVAEYERAVVLRMGRLLANGQGTKGPGLFFVLPCIDSVRKVELRTVTFSIPPQEVLTRDSVTVAVDAVVYYRICNPALSFLNVEDAARSTRLLAQTTLRNVLGTKDLAQILMEREEMSVTMQSNLDSATEAWGVKVERVEIKDVRLPVALQRAMAAEAEATREARARVIAAKGEHRASSALKEAAMVISSSPLALQLRYLQTMCTISAEKNSTIIFPLPIDILQSGRALSNFLAKSPAGDLDSRPSSVMQWLPEVTECVGVDLQTSTLDIEKQLKNIERKSNFVQAEKLQSCSQPDDYENYSDSV